MIGLEVLARGWGALWGVGAAAQECGADTPPGWCLSWILGWSFFLLPLGLGGAHALAGSVAGRV